MKITAGWSSHLPVLNRVISLVNGPVLELGTGLFSTPFLHWMCQDKGVRLESFEQSEEYYNIFHHVRRSRTFQNKNHNITLVKDWDKIDIDNTHWSLVFIDHNTERRSIDTIRLANKADYIVIHDTQDSSYNYDSVWSHFKYVKHFDQFSPRTSVVSNFYEVKDL